MKRSKTRYTVAQLKEIFALGYSFGVVPKESKYGNVDEAYKEGKKLFNDTYVQKLLGLTEF